MNNLKNIIVFLFLLFSPLFVFSQEEAISISEQFKQDTAYIELKYRADTDYTTMGMIAANIELEKDYDELLNKYYKILLTKLNNEQKKTIRDSQRNWIKLRDSDREVVAMLREKVYKDAGGGSMWGVISSGALVDITKQRVVQIYNFLMFDIINEE